MALELVLTASQLEAIEKLALNKKYHAVHLFPRQWDELVSAGYCYRDGEFYRAHETYETPSFQMCEPDAKGISSESGDIAFEDSRNHLYENGTLQR